MHADAGPASVNHLVELSLPVVCGGSVVDLAQGATGYLTTKDRVEASPCKTQTVGARIVGHVDQADVRQVPLKWEG